MFDITLQMNEKQKKANTLFLILTRLQRLQSKIIKLVDVSYGGENGFNQAIELAAESLQNVKFIQEKKLIGRYFDEISQVSVQIDCGLRNHLLKIIYIF